MKEILLDKEKPPVEASPLRKQFSSLYDEAVESLPHTVEDAEQAEAWVAQRILGLAQRDHNRTRSLQTMLVSYINTEHIWMHHPENYETLRDFLKGVGDPLFGNKLNLADISHFCSIAEIIDPFCKAKDIPLNPIVEGKDWGKLVSAISPLRKAIEEEDNPEPAVRAILEDVKSLPSRKALRNKYRKTEEKEIVGDAINVNDFFLVGLVVRARDWPSFKAKLGKDVNWEVLLDRIENGAVLRLEEK